MKRFLFFSMLMLVFISCSDDDNFITPVSHSFQIDFGENYENRPAANVSINLINREDGKVYTETTNDQGEVTLDVVPGIYNVEASLVMTAAEYMTFSGQTVDSEIGFNVSYEGLEINEEGQTETSLSLVTGRIGNLLIKQVYYSGSDVRLGALYRDQFFEIHNNSNETIYLDGLYFAQIYGEASISSELDSFNLPNGQYDWSQSLDQQYIDEANDGYVYADEVLQFPGGGEDYPLLSGESVIVAATAVNHKSPLTVIDEDGEQVVYEVPNPELTIDLSNAPFEAYYRPYQESQGSAFLDSDIDNPNSDNMIIAFKSFSGRDLILDPLGRDAYVIFDATEEDFNNWHALTSPSITLDNVSETTPTYLQIPIFNIIDGVETQRNDPSRAKPKRLPDAIDAGEIATIKGSYSSESVIRKISQENDGKVFYQDTNNSSNDFEVLEHPEVNIEN